MKKHNETPKLDKNEKISFKQFIKEEYNNPIVETEDPLTVTDESSDDTMIYHGSYVSNSPLTDDPKDIVIANEDKSPTPPPSPTEVVTEEELSVWKVTSIKDDQNKTHGKTNSKLKPGKKFE